MDANLLVGAASTERLLGELGHLDPAKTFTEASYPLLAEGREIFERLGAQPWLERLERVGGVRAEVPA